MSCSPSAVGATRLGLLAGMLWLGLGAMSSARADEALAGVGVIRSSDNATAVELADAVDGALLRDLAALAGIDSPVVSPVDFAEVQLSVGCSDDSSACFEAIARTLRVGALVVRVLLTDPAQGVRLELRYFDSASRDEPRVVSSVVPASASAQLIEAVPGLVRELFGIEEVVAPAPSETPPAAPLERAHAEPPPRAAASTSIAPFILIGAGSAVLLTGIVVGAVAQDDYATWKQRTIRSPEQAQEASEEFDRLADRALIANLLMPVGAAALALGGTWLAIELLGDTREAEPNARLDLVPAAGGALLVARGRFREPL